MVPCLASSSSLSSSSSAAAGAAARPLLSPHHPRAITIDPLPQHRSPSTPPSSRRRPGGAGKKSKIKKKKIGKAALKKKKAPTPPHGSEGAEPPLRRERGTWGGERAGARSRCRRRALRGWAASRWPSGLSARLSGSEPPPVTEGDNGAGEKKPQLPRCPRRVRIAPFLPSFSSSPIPPPGRPRPLSPSRLGLPRARRSLLSLRSHSGGGSSNVTRGPPGALSPPRHVDAAHWRRRGAGRASWRCRPRGGGDGCGAAPAQRGPAAARAPARGPVAVAPHATSALGDIPAGAVVAFPPLLPRREAPLSRPQPALRGSGPEGSCPP
ncbi:serine/arginine repetitive matrix protein 2-like [Prinia subflava]|uniref:serine/arginine repetitive matrix protein 2-like n=1 Tax=Prinia subflava TaxID=208062 RepID=UPI002FDF505D